MVDEPTGLENELLSDEVEVEEVAESDPSNHDNAGQYGWVELDGKQCTNSYTSESYGQQYCVGDTYTDPNGGSYIVTGISMTGLQTDPQPWTAEDTYEEAGAKLGLTEDEWGEFVTELHSLNAQVDGIVNPLFTNEDKVRGRLGIRIRQENPDWTEEQINEELDRRLSEEYQNSAEYKAAVEAENALFEKYGIQKQNKAVYGTGLWVDENGKSFRFESATGNFYQTSQDDGFLDYAVPIGIAIGAAMIGGQVGGLVTGGFGAGAGSQAAAGAINSVIGSAISQAAVTGGVDFDSLVQSALLGGFGGLADAMVDGALAGTQLDEMIWDLADKTGLEYAQIVDIAEGMASGAVTGGDLEDIVLGAVSNIGQDVAMNLIEDTFGDILNVDDLFKPGQSHIPVEALEPLIGLGFQAALEGGASTEDILKAAFGYFSAGGDIDFLLPDTPDMSGFLDWLGGLLPGLDFEKGGWGIGYDKESGDIVVNHDFDFDFELPGGVDLPEIGNPCTKDGQEGTLIGGTLAGTFVCEIDIDTPWNCSPEQEAQGWTWDNLVGECIPPIEGGPELPPLGTPCSVDGDQGIWALTELDELVCEVDIKIETPYDCSERGEGWTWDNLVGDCIPPVSVDPICGAGEWDEVLEACLCGDGSPENSDGTCPDIKIDTPYDCSERGAGWTWDNLVGDCIPPAPDGPDWNPGDPCSDEDGNEGFLNEMGVCELPDIDITNPCEEQGGWLNEMGLCEFPEVDINMPQFNNTTYDMGPRASLYDYDQFVASETPGPREFEQYLSEARGLLDL